MAKAKVINMKVQISKKKFVNIVTAANPIVTPEMIYKMFHLSGKIVSAEVSKEMPLLIALFHSHRLKVKLGII